MKRLIVKPMPHSSATPYNCVSDAWRGRLATPVLMASHAKPNTPSCLPRNRPSATPSGTGCARLSSPMPANETPALAKPNTGTISSATGLCSACSRSCSGECACGWPALRGRSGIVSASATPASVACTPDFSTKYPRAAPGRR
ncbi:hypothetical protein G6F22_019257 [Rhizopus arrhizus]|nr:hypothetical protein G6F22_019257 [Rhizopus arrhizus]